MGRRIVPVTGETFGDLPQPCRDCAFWEAGPGPRGRAGAAVAQAVLKAEWVESTGTAWGPCGLLAYVDDVPACYVMYAPPAFVPRAVAFPTSPIGQDAVLLTAAYVLPEHRGAGLGRVLVQAAAKDLTQRGVRAIEAYGAVDQRCVLPPDFLESVGFVRVREHARNPRLRLDLRTAVTWRDPVGGALEKIRGAVRAFPAGANRT